MKGNPAFSLQSIGDVYLLVPLQDETFEIEKIIPTNEVGDFLWSILQNECTEEILRDALTAEYDISPETARKDIRQFLEVLKKAGALLE